MHCEMLHLNYLVTVNADLQQYAILIRTVVITVPSIRDH